MGYRSHSFALTKVSVTILHSLLQDHKRQSVPVKDSNGPKSVWLEPTFLTKLRTKNIFVWINYIMTVMRKVLCIEKNVVITKMHDHEKYSNRNTKTKNILKIECQQHVGKIKFTGEVLSHLCHLSLVSLKNLGKD